jgi:DnaJ domain
MFGFFLILLLVASTAAILMTTPAQRLAGALRLILPFSLIAIGAALTLIGRLALGMPLAVLGVTIWRRGRSPATFGRAGSSPKSTVRTAMFEMELDHDTGDMDGLVLTGDHEGSWLSSLSRQELFNLLLDTSQDAESAALLEAYLDRSIPGWREDTQANADTRQTSSAGSGPMTKQEAYQILGLSPGAGANEIHDAHRRLMKRVHPDSGGSTFLASKINEAKDILLG